MNPPNRCAGGNSPDPPAGPPADRPLPPGYEFLPSGYQPAFVRVRGLAAAMAQPGRGAGYLPIVQFIKHWNHMPWCRDAMIADDPPADTDAVTAAKIAAVVHALCDNAGRPAPAWVAQAVAPTDTPLVPSIDLEFADGRDVRAEAPPACRYHRVYFSAELLDSTRPGGVDHRFATTNRRPAPRSVRQPVGASTRSAPLQPPHDDRRRRRAGPALGAPLTSDVDVLDHRLRWEHHHGQRLASAVEFISMRFPADLRRAAHRPMELAARQGWLNNAAGLYTPISDLEAEVLYRSDTLTIEAPGPRILLAMKLHARRDKDLDDAARLVAETGISEEEPLLSLVAEAFGAEAATPTTGRFVALALSQPEANAAAPTLGRSADQPRRRAHRRDDAVG